MKKYLFGLLAVVFAIAFSAFTTAKNNSAFDWFAYVGEEEVVIDFDSDDPDQFTEAKKPANYILTEDDCNEEDAILCRIFAEVDNLNLPIITEDLEDDLEEYVFGTDVAATLREKE